MDINDPPVIFGIIYAFLASGGRCGQFISPCTIDSMLLPSGNVTHRGCTFGLIFLTGVLSVRKFPVAPESKISICNNWLVRHFGAAAFGETRFFACSST